MIHTIVYTATEYEDFEKESPAIAVLRFSQQVELGDTILFQKTDTRDQLIVTVTRAISANPGLKAGYAVVALAYPTKDKTGL